MAIKKFELDKANDLDKNKLPIQTVNGKFPDANGNIVAGAVNTINGNLPDDNGNITPDKTGCLPLSGGAMTGDVNMGAYQLNDVGSIEFSGAQNNEGFGGFIDFHYNGSTEDYTARIIEQGASGKLNIIAPNGLWINGRKSVAVPLYTAGNQGGFSTGGTYTATVNGLVCYWCRTTGWGGADLYVNGVQVGHWYGKETGSTLYALVKVGDTVAFGNSNANADVGIIIYGWG